MQMWEVVLTISHTDIYLGVFINGYLSAFILKHSLGVDNYHSSILELPKVELIKLLKDIDLRYSSAGLHWLWKSG